MAMKVTGTVTITNTETGETVEDLVIDITDATSDEIQALLDGAARTIEVTVSRYRTPRGWEYEWSCDETPDADDGFDTIAAAERSARAQLGDQCGNVNIHFTQDWE